MNEENPKVKVVLAGASGYGATHLRTLLEQLREDRIELAGVADVLFANEAYKPSEQIEQLKELNVPLFSSLEDFYASGSADLAVIAAPIQFHKPLTLLALEKGSHVYCEKPVASCLDDALAMQKAAEEHGKILAIGFQWSYSEAIQAVKQDIIDGVWGKAIQLKTLILWPRSRNYYARAWAGKKYAADGAYIMDSIAMNATAHYLHNMLFVLGREMNRSAEVESVDSVLHRANAIETFDACEISVTTKDGAELTFLAAHCTESLQNPVFSYLFEKGTVSYDSAQNEIVGRFHDGTVKSYGKIEERSLGLQAMIRAVETGDPQGVACVIDAALAHMKVMEQVNDTLYDVYVVPDARKKWMEIDGNEVMAAKGMDAHMKKLYDEIDTELTKVE